MSAGPTAAGARRGPGLPAGVATVRETASDDRPPLFTASAWAERFPWLIHGTTGAGPGGDYALFGGSPTGPALTRWRLLQERLGTPRAVHGRQVHGARVLRHGAGGPGVSLADGWDGHVTDAPGVLLAVSLADCAPISLVDARRRRIALLHGGWRGTAAGIIEAGLDALDADPAAVAAHIGPAICGACYEVGPEVFGALGLEPPDGPTPVDLRAVQAGRLVDAGVPAAQVTVSEWCTRCADAFYSHRAGDVERQLGVLAIRP